MAALLLWSSAAGAQTISHRGLLEGEAFLFPQRAASDTTRGVVDLLFRDELSVRPAEWLQLAAGIELRANSHDQVEHEWRVDWSDRGVRRPRAAVRQLSATVTRGPFTVTLGKQLIRWARADIANPIDRFAPRDFMQVIDAEYLGVTALRPAFQHGSHAIEAVWLPRLTPSRLPLLDQRWTIVPPDAAGLSFQDDGSRFPSRGQAGARWTHTGARLELGLSFFRGHNHLPHIEAQPGELPQTLVVARTFPRLRMYGVDAGVPLRWASVKAEAAYFSSPDDASGSYGLYVVEIERQLGEWLLVAAYAGDAGASPGPAAAFDPEREMAPAILGRASYTVDPRRSITLEVATRQNGNGQYAEAEYSQAFGLHWRLNVTGTLIAGRPDDFLGQFRRNSHVSSTVRFSF